MEVDRKSGISNTALILDGIHVIQTDKGICINRKYEYNCGDSLEDYLERETRQKGFRYLMIPHDFFGYRRELAFSCFLASIFPHFRRYDSL